MTTQPVFSTPGASALASARGIASMPPLGWNMVACMSMFSWKLAAAPTNGWLRVARGRGFLATATCVPAPGGVAKPEAAEPL